MPLEVTVIPRKSHLLVQVSGKYDLSEAVERFRLVIDACRVEGLDRVLVDLIEMGGDIAAVQKILYTYETVEHYREHLAVGGKPLRFAYVGKAPQISTFEPGREIAESENLDLLITTDFSAAMEWLGLNQPTA